MNAIDRPQFQPGPPPLGVRNPDEIATVEVNGRRYDDWESVWVQHRWTEDCPLFRFTAVERDPLPRYNNFEKLQFKPGDLCAIYLGGLLAVAGVILVRQVAYDANSHGIMLQGKGVQWYAATSSIEHKDHNFDGKTFTQVAQEVLAPTGIAGIPVGDIDNTPFKRLQSEPGETVWNFLERIARPRGVILGSDHMGNLLLISQHSGLSDGDLVEGYNILKCQAVWNAEHLYSKYGVLGQSPANNEQNGAQQSEQAAAVGGSAKRYRPLWTSAEQPVWSVAELARRAQNENKWNEGTFLNVSITTPGWFQSRATTVDGRPMLFPWRAGSHYRVNSPMAIVNRILKAETVTYTQDNQAGTLTQLDLKNPAALNGSVPGQVDDAWNEAAREVVGALATPAAGPAFPTYPTRMP